MSIVRRYRKGADFWHENAQIADIEAFKSFRDKDTSDNKEESSNVMWAIALIYDYESDHRKIKFNERVDMIESDFLKMPNFFEKKEHFLKPIIDAYNKLQHDSPRRALVEWEEGMDKRTEFLDRTQYTIQNARDIDAVRANTKKLFDDLKRIKEDIEKAEAGTNVQGGASLSMLEQDDI